MVLENQMEQKVEPELETAVTQGLHGDLNQVITRFSLKFGPYHSYKPAIRS